MNSIFLTDGYKLSHHNQLPEGTTHVYSNLTPRRNSYGHGTEEGVVVFGTQYVLQFITEHFNKHFFAKDRAEVEAELTEELSLYSGLKYDASHFMSLHDLGYLPIKVKALREGTICPFGVPMLTITNTLENFAWVTNFLETIISNLIWLPITSATTAREYKKILLKYAEKTDKDNVSFVDFQAHDFSMRGMGGLDATIASGMGHAVNFTGSDNIPIIKSLRKYYLAKGFIVAGVPASEHSLVCAGGKGNEKETLTRMLETYPTGIFSYVSDTWDLWELLTKTLPEMKDIIMARDGKLVVRPDSGDPVDILCGTEQNIVYKDTINIEQHISWTFIDNGHGFPAKYLVHKGKTYRIFPSSKIPQYVYFVEEDLKAEQKGTIEILWDVFGGTINEQGYKVLDPHIGAIYGDSISIERCKQICKRLEAKGFASTNVVFGLGSFSYQYRTRDTYGIALKATNVTINGEDVAIFKDPVTDSGLKKSAKGLLCVDKNDKGEYYLLDGVDRKTERTGYLKEIYRDGNFLVKTTLDYIRKQLNDENKG